MLTTSDRKVTVYQADNAANGIVFPLADFAIVCISDRMTADNIEKLSSKLANIMSDCCCFFLLKGDSLNFHSVAAKIPMTFEKIVHVHYEKIYKERESEIGFIFRKSGHLQYAKTEWLQKEPSNTWHCSMALMPTSLTHCKAIPVDILCMIESLVKKQYSSFIMYGISTITPEMKKYIKEGNHTAHIYCQQSATVKKLINDYEGEVNENASDE